MKLSDIKPNQNNPRLIKDDKFKKLCRSIKEFPQMMALRPIVVDADGVILGGNMRYQAIKHNGMTEIPNEWVKRADDLTDEQKREFIVKDNVGFGEWDWDILANEWEPQTLEDWGLCIDAKGICNTQIIGDGSSLDGSNYGDKSSKSSVSFTLLSVEGLIDKDFARAIEAKLIESGAIPGEDNGLIIQEALKYILV